VKLVNMHGEKIKVKR